MGVRCSMVVVSDSQSHAKMCWQHGTHFRPLGCRICDTTTSMRITLCGFRQDGADADFDFSGEGRRA